MPFPNCCTTNTTGVAKAQSWSHAWFWRVQATDQDWIKLQGKFLLNDFPSKAIIFSEGPPPGTDILINSLVVNRVVKPPPPLPSVVKVSWFVIFFFCLAWQ